MQGFMYILECSDGSYYTGSTNDLERRLHQHQIGMGASHKKKRLPVKLMYFEEFKRIDEAFYREKQVQRWSRKKKEALISRDFHKLNALAECKNETHFAFDSASFDSASFDSASFDSASFDSASFDSAQATESSVVERSRNHVSPNCKKKRSKYH